VCKRPGEKPNTCGVSGKVNGRFYREMGIVEEEADEVHLLVELLVEDGLIGKNDV